MKNLGLADKFGVERVELKLITRFLELGCVRKLEAGACLGKMWELSVSGH